MPRTLLLVWLHGFKGTDDTFSNFPKDLRSLLAHSLPKVDIVTISYPQYETRGDLRECVGQFKEWLQNKVIDLEVANRTPSPTVDPSVHVILCGHSMGGIVAAETLLSIARDEPVPHYSEGFNLTNSTNSTTSAGAEGTTEELPDHSSLFFPHVRGVLAFDTPYLGISPGVLAHGAEAQINNASAAYKAFDSASNLFGWGSNRTATTAGSAARALPAPETAAATKAAAGMGWGKMAMLGGAAAAAVAGAAGAAYLSRNQINQGFTWASSHLEFVGCLARGAELQKRVEGVVRLNNTHNVGFADFYTALGEKVTSKTKYAGQLLGEDRTFCIIPKSSRKGSPTGSKRDAPNAEAASRKKRQTATPQEQTGMQQGEQVHEFAQDPSKSKGTWVKCVNPVASDEITAHTTMFTPSLNPHYHTMLPTARDYIAGWVDQQWYHDVHHGEDARATYGPDSSEEKETHEAQKQEVDETTTAWASP